MKARVLGAALLAAWAARAEPAALSSRDGGLAVQAAFGLQGAFAATAGVTQGLAGPRQLSLGGDLTWVAGAADLGDLRLRGRVASNVVRSGAFLVRASLAPAWTSTRNASARLDALGLELQAAAGLSRERWALALSASVQQQVLTHIALSDAYRAQVYADAREGWYRGTARTLRAGLEANVLAGPVEVGAALGLERTGALDFLPGAYAVVSLATRLR